MKRPIRALELGDTQPNEIISVPPEVRLVNPSLLLVDDVYQRSLSENSIRLIRRIVTGWDWARFKPPVCAEVEGEVLEVIDGQHTAMAAATHPAIDIIPVMVVRAETTADRARAFVGHNKDRLNITPMQMHFSALAAGDEDALTVQQVCEKAGVVILRNPPAQNRFKPGETLALSAVRGLIGRHGARGARLVLEVLANAKAAPVSADGIKAVEALFYEEEYAGTIEAEDITSTLIRMGPEALKQARVFHASHKVPVWRGLAVTLYRNTRKKRKAA